MGLGNPGARYDHTRHNLGFWFVDKIAEEARALAFEKNPFQALTTSCRWEGHQLLLVKPQTYMNLSGQCVGPLLRFFKVPVERLVVVCDDLDQEPGAVRLRQGGSHGGHNGLRSLLEQLPSDAFYRLKIGIGKPSYKSQIPSWVLEPFDAQTQEYLDADTFMVAKSRLKNVLK